MPAIAIVLLLSAAACHATWNFFAKGARNDAGFQLAFICVSAVAYLPTAIVAVVWTWPLDPAGIGFAAASAPLHLAYYVLLSSGYRAGDLSLVYPLARGTGPVFAVAGGIILYNEAPTPLALAGTGLVVAGIVLMSWNRPSRTGTDVGRAVSFALLTGMMTATYTLWDKHGVSLLTPLLYSYVLDIVRIGLLAPLTARASVRESAIRAAREQPRAVAAIGLLSPLAYILVLAALATAPVSYVAPAREVSILFGAVLGLRLLGESDPLRRLIGASAIVGGVVALALG